MKTSANVMREDTEMVTPSLRSGSLRSPSLRFGVTISKPMDQALTEAGRPAADPEVITKAVRRQFTAGYKRRILQEADRCGPGGIAALLRREGLESSHLTSWRKQRETGEIAGLQPRKRGKKAVGYNPLTAENERLRRDNGRLQKRLCQAETIIEVQKKLCDVLGLTVPPIGQNGSNE